MELKRFAREGGEGNSEKAYESFATGAKIDSPKAEVIRNAKAVLARNGWSPSEFLTAVAQQLTDNPSEFGLK